MDCGECFQGCNVGEDSEQVSDLPPGSTSTGSEPVVPSLLDRFTSSAKVRANTQTCTREESVSFRKPLRLTAVS